MAIQRYRNSPTGLAPDDNGPLVMWRHVEDHLGDIVDAERERCAQLVEDEMRRHQTIRDLHHHESEDYWLAQAAANGIQQAARLIRGEAEPHVDIGGTGDVEPVDICEPEEDIKW